MKASKITVLLATLWVAAYSVLTSADTIELQDGRKLSGTVSRQGNQATIKTDDGQTITAAWSDITRVWLSGPADSPAASNGASPDLAKSEWTRIAAQIKTAPDLPAIITLHQSFLTKYPDSPVADQVKESLAIYQQLASQNAIKFHNKWMLPDQVDVLQKQWTEAARAPLILYSTGDYAKALDSAKSILAKDNQNPDALTLAGLAAYSAKNYGVARKYFTDLAESDPTSGLAQNNLAIISFQQKQLSDGLTHYAKALALLPANPLLLDNLTELMNVYKDSGGDVKAPNFRALSAAYATAESALEAEMVKRGLFRIGSTWAAPAEIAIAVKNAKMIHDQMDQLDAKYKLNHQKVADAEQKITQAFADEDAAAESWMITSGALNKAKPGSPAFGAAVGNFNIAQTKWQKADQNTVRQLVRRFDFRLREMRITAPAEKLRAQLADNQGFFPGQLRMMDATTSAALAGDYNPRPLAADATKPLDPLPRSTVSNPEDPNELAENGTVKIAYRPLDVVIVNSEFRTDWGTPFLLEVPTEQPGTYLSAYGDALLGGVLGGPAGGGERVLLYNSKKWPRYWIDDMRNPATAPQLMPPEYVGGALGLSGPSWGFGHRVSDATTVGPITRRGNWTFWTPYAHTKDD